MSLNINPQNLPRYQTWGMVGVVLLILVTIFGFLISRQYFDQTKVADLHEEVLSTQKRRLKTELASVLDYIRFMSQQAESVLAEDAKSYVNQAHSVATSLYTSLKDKLPDAKIQEIIRESLRDVRFFNGRGYLFIDDMQGQCILLPTAPQLEGTSLWDNQDDTGHYIMRGLVDAVKNPERAGISRYRWYPPGDNKVMKSKLAYVRYFEPFDWVIGTGDYLYQTENDLKQEALKRISSLRFGRNGYVSVLDRDGFVLFAPNTQERQLPKHVSLLRSEQERKVVQQILDVAKQGGGFTEYEWLFPDDSGHSSKKLSLVEVVPYWNWILVAGVYPEEIDQIFRRQVQEEQKDLTEDLWFLLLVLSAIGLVMLLISWAYGQWLRRLFLDYQADIKAQKYQIDEDARELQIASRVFETAREGIMVTDPENRIVAVNRSFTEITGYTSDEVKGVNPKILSSGRHSPDFYRRMWTSLMETDQWAGEIWNTTKGGQTFPEHLSLSVFRDEQGEVVNYVATFSDVTEQKLAEEQLRYMAEYDDLTGMPNRRLLMDRVNQTIARAKRQQLRCFTLMFIDLDRFKNINDSLGHSAGDQVLQEVAQRLQGAVREIDTVSRIGGDEFVVLVSGKGDDAIASAANLSRRLLRMISEPIVEQGVELIVTPSIGIASYPADGEDFETLLRNADAALYHAKSLGRNNFQFYSAEMNEKASSRLIMENGLRQALEKKAFELYYQPQYDMQTRRLSGCEALIRWCHEGELIAPDQFIPLAEETGLILSIGEWVLREGCRQGAEWLSQGYDVPSVAINVSAVQFRYEFYSTVKEVLKETGFPAERLVLEVTESTLMKDAVRARQLLMKLKLLGVQIALDDFGTGYSSLAYLKKFSLDKLKIDRAFIDGLPNDKDDKAIVGSILDVARHLGLETIAEGVETVEQAEFLTMYRCEQAQGFLFSKAIPAKDFTDLIKKNYAS